MNLESIFQKESTNERHIYLYYARDGREGWLAYGRSACYLSLLRPFLPVREEHDASGAVLAVEVFVPENNLPDLTDNCPALIDDTCVQLEVPASVLCAGTDTLPPSGAGRNRTVKNHLKQK